MENLLLLITGFIGALIGAAASIVTTYLQNKSQNKRERMKLVSDLALEDFKLSLEMAKHSGKPFTIMPITVYSHYHSKLLEALESGDLDEDRIVKLTEANKKVIESIKKVSEKYDAQPDV